MKFQEKIKAWLGEYKREKLCINDSGVWNRNQKAYDHILPEYKKDFNYLTPFKSECENFVRSHHIKLHLNYHHLNSSQVMCLNMFIPLIEERCLEILLPEIGILNDSVDYDTVCFEKKSKIETKHRYRPTSFDFYFRTKNGKEVFFEIKYTEYEFGKANIKSDDYIGKYNTVYKSELSVINAARHTCDDFLSNYQLMRNLIHVSENSYVVFVYPENNKIIAKQAKMAKSDLIDETYKDHVVNLPWEELTNLVKTQCSSPKLILQLKEFSCKYMIKSDIKNESICVDEEIKIVDGE